MMKNLPSLSSIKLNKIALAKRKQTNQNVPKRHYHLINMIIVSYVAYISVLLHFTVVALNNNNHNYVRETPNKVLKSKLSKDFRPPCDISDTIKESKTRWHKVSPDILHSLKRKEIFFDDWPSEENQAHCVCKCCTCQESKKPPKLLRQRRTYDRIYQFRRKFRPYYVPLIRKKYRNTRYRRRSPHSNRKRFNFGKFFNSVKNSTVNAVATSIDAIENTAVDAYGGAKDALTAVKNEYKTITGTLSPLENCTAFLNSVNKELESLYNKNIVAQWNYESNLTESNKVISLQSDINFSTKIKQQSEKVFEFDKEQNCSGLDVTLGREIKFLTKLQESVLPTDDYAELQNILRSMESIFSKAVIKDFKDNTRIMHLEPDITERMARSRDVNELEYIWESWRIETGLQIKKYYPRYIELLTKSAQLNGFKDVAEMWLSVYERPEFEEKIYHVWNQIKPLYELLHAYVRNQLTTYYGQQIIRNNYIPAHLLGNVFGQTWINIYNITVPYPLHRGPDITAQLKLKHYDPLKMFQEAEKFFTSLGLPAMTHQFWTHSILEPNPKVQMVCHASAWDMYDKRDFRIKMCTHVTFEDFIVAHHEMGHVEYYMLYKDLPVVFREGANPGFHEAIGDTIALSVASSAHIASLGLKVDQNYENSHQSDINYLFLMALQKIAFIPYSLVVETWRWDVFKGNVLPKEYNQHWWDLRKKFQGILPPQPRNVEYFDPGAKYHIAAGVPYIRYFVSFVIQFQFHEALCQEAGKNNQPLHKCDIYKSNTAGKRLKDALSLGKSVPWIEVMKKLTDSKDICAHSLLKYFKPLERWLREEIHKRNITVGWDLPINKQ